MTTFSMDFDFRSAEQTAILTEMQNAGYSLLGYKGATGANQLTVGVPTWFSVPYTKMFGDVEIDYTPSYLVYVSNQSTIAVNTTISMQVQSNPQTLGSALTFNSNGTFGSGGVSNVPPASIGLFNNSGNAVTVGLACNINLPTGSSYLPFCAFTLQPLNSIIMTPQETIILVASQTSLQSGSVQASVSAPGCSFAFSNSTVAYDLMMLKNSYAITNVAGSAPVSPVSSGSTIGAIINT